MLACILLSCSFFHSLEFAGVAGPSFCHPQPQHMEQSAMHWALKGFTQSDFDRDETWVFTVCQSVSSSRVLVYCRRRIAARTQPRLVWWHVFPPRLLCLPQEVVWPWNGVLSNGWTAWRKWMYREVRSRWTLDRVQPQIHCRTAQLKKLPQVMLECKLKLNDYSAASYRSALWLTSCVLMC